MARGIFSALTSPSVADMNELSDVPRCRLTHNAAQSIANNTTVALLFNTETYDAAAPNAMHDTVTNNSRITIPTGGAGFYVLTASVRFTANATGVRELGMRVNGVTSIASAQQISNSGTTATQLTVATLYRLNVGDYVEATVLQSSGAALNTVVTTDVSPTFAACWLAVY